MTAVPAVALLSARMLRQNPDGGARATIASAAPGSIHCYGSGKAALRDALALRTPGRGDVALVPSYLPDGVVEPFADVGIEVRPYPVTPSLEPDPAALEALADADTAVVLAVNYFGFPQTGLPTLRAVADRTGALLVDDNAQAPLSRDGDVLLGTRGDVGITSLRKGFPVPNGAFLYDGDEATTDWPLAGRGGYGRRELRTLTEAALARVARRPVVGGVVRAARDVVRGTDADRTRDPRAVYERSKAPMSPLALRVLAGVDPGAEVARRRENYRAWRTGLADRPGVETVSEGLPDGVCPQACPVVASDPDRFLTALEAVGVEGAHTWPPLPDVVASVPRFATANRLAARLVPLPVHRDVDPTAVEAVCRRLADPC